VIAVAPHHVRGTETEANEDFRIIEIHEFHIVGHFEGDKTAGPALLGTDELRGEPGGVVAEGFAYGALGSSARIQGGVVIRVVEAASTLSVEGYEERMERLPGTEIGPVRIDPGDPVQPHQA
jgi:hypothetical protein